MGTWEELPFGRREFMVGTAALAVLPSRAFAAPAAGPRLGDAHVHLFNLADLPARGFFEHGVMWNTPLDYWLLRPMWPAMLDMISFLKSKSLTAAKELETYSYEPDRPEDIAQPEFTKLANQRISNMARQSRAYGGAYRIELPEPLSAAQHNLRNSYHQLAAVLAIAGQPMWYRIPGEAPQRAVLSDADVIRIRRGARHLHERACPEAPSASDNMGKVEVVLHTLEWGRMLMQSRQHHLAAYRKRIRDGGLGPRTIVNLLVDYDEWLGDAPASGSGNEAQIAFWNRIRGDYCNDERNPIDIRTFVGFDPLKDLLERESGTAAGGTTFERNCAHIREQRLFGFKLYPPMGFRPARNQAAMFQGDRRALAVVRERFRQAGLEWEDLPRLLNESLDRLYGFCAANRVPILAHAFHSNEASLCAGARAGPSGWLDVRTDYPRGLRVCLGHFAEGGDFVRATRRRAEGRRISARNWPFHGTDELLRRNALGASEFFVDLGYMAEFLHEERGLDLAIDFFRALKHYCEHYDRGCRHFMFGSDWIMLEREARNDRYVSRMREAMTAAHWEEQWQANLLHENLQRFLQPHPAV